MYTNLHITDIVYDMALLPDGRGGWDKVPGSAGRTLGQHGFSRHLALPKCSAKYPLLPLRFHVYIYIIICMSRYINVLYIYVYVCVSFCSLFIPLWFLFYSHVICRVSRLFCHQLLFYSHWVLLHAPLILILSQIYFPVIPKQFLGCCLQLPVTGIAKKESERETS